LNTVFPSLLFHPSFTSSALEMSKHFPFSGVNVSFNNSSSFFCFFYHYLINKYNLALRNYSNLGLFFF
jgi:hypothetical protein